MSYDAVRRYPRIESTPERPIKIAFKQKEMQEISHQIDVRDISEVGIGLKVPLGKRFLKEGLMLEDIEITLPGVGKCVLSGKIVYKRLGHCGLEFVDYDPAEFKKLEQFTGRASSEVKTTGKGS
jgi:c-di-GMP-binding flagellar brake protein YcgR